MGTSSSYRWLFFLIWVLVVLGAYMVGSVSVFESHKLMIKIHGLEYCETNNCNGFYLWRHVKHIILGIPIFLMALLIPLSFWKKVALPMYFVVLVILMGLLVTSIGGDWGTAKSWINISFLPSIQPSEAMKIAMIFYLAIWMDKKEKIIQTWSGGFIPFLILMSIPVVLLALQPDFGSLLVIASIAAVMFFTAGGNIGHIILGGIIAGVSVSVLILIFASDCDGPNRGPFCYITERVAGFLGDTSDADENYQVKQSLITIGSGRVFGVGIGESGQRHGWLPEAQSDTIFAIAGEELGFVGMFFLVGIFMLISLLGYQTAKNARNRFEMLVASGITAWVTFQALINMAVVTKLFPVTGITLPFVSYGGSSLLTLLFASGILLQVSKYSSSHENRSSRRRIRRTHISGTRSI